MIRTKLLRFCFFLMTPSIDISLLRKFNLQLIHFQTEDLIDIFYDKLNLHFIYVQMANNRGWFIEHDFRQVERSFMIEDGSTIVDIKLDEKKLFIRPPGNKDLDLTLEVSFKFLD